MLRRHERQGVIEDAAAATGLRMLDSIIDHRYVHHGWLAIEAWKLRHTISFYDGLYAALAARLGVPLLTSDAKLTRAPGLPCDIELIG